MRVNYEGPRLRSARRAASGRVRYLIRSDGQEGGLEPPNLGSPLSPRTVNLHSSTVIAPCLLPRSCLRRSTCEPARHGGVRGVRWPTVRSWCALTLIWVWGPTV